VSDTIVPAEDACFNLIFSGISSVFTIDTSAATSKHLAIFTAHAPTEFERDTHFFLDAAMGDVEAVAQDPAAASSTREKNYRWGDAIGAAILVNLCTLLGVVFLGMYVLSYVKAHYAFVQAALSSFSGGAIFSFTVYLILVEASHYIAVGHPGEDEVEVTWRYGTVVLAGYLIAWFCEIVFSMFTSDEDAPTAKPESKMDPENGAKGDELDEPRADIRKRTLFAVLVGDGMHNLVDGFFIGIAFSYCSSSKGWKIAAVTIAHELAQELADYLIFTINAGMKPALALGLNFLSGTTVILGTIIAVAGDPSQEATGLLLAFGGGAYLHVAQECMVRVFQATLTKPQKWVTFLLFIIGAVAIGLILLDHEHCSRTQSTGDAAADPHAGHNH